MGVGLLGLQLVVLAVLVVAWRQWRGHRTAWLEGRRRGWRVHRRLATACILQAFVLLGFAGEHDAAGAGVAGFLLLVVVSPVLLGLGVIGAPRFLLPGWVRERLAAGDLARSTHPDPALDHLMAAPQNRQPVQGPEREQSDVGGWLIGAVVCVVIAVGLGSSALGLGPLGVEPGQMLTVGSRPTLVSRGNLWQFQALFAVLSLGCAAGSVYFARGVPAQWRLRQRLRAERASGAVTSRGS